MFKNSWYFTPGQVYLHITLDVFNKVLVIKESHNKVLITKKKNKKKIKHNFKILKSSCWFVGFFPQMRSNIYIFKTDNRSPLLR